MENETEVSNVKVEKEFVLSNLDSFAEKYKLEAELDEETKKPIYKKNNFKRP